MKLDLSEIIKIREASGLVFIRQTEDNELVFQGTIRQFNDSEAYMDVIDMALKYEDYEFIQQVLS